MHPQHTKVARLAVAQHTGGHQGVGGGDVRLFQQIAQGLAACRTAHAAAKVDQRALGGVDQLCRPADIVLVIAGDGADQLRCLGGKLAGRGGDILGDIHQHGTLAPRLCNAERRPHRVRQILHAAHGVVVLGDGHRNALDIRFLKGILAQQAGCHVAGKGDHRHAVHIGGGNAGDKVGSAGAAGRQHHTGAPGGAGVAVRRVGSTLLVRGQYMAYTVRVFIQFVV